MFDDYILDEICCYCYGDENLYDDNNDDFYYDYCCDDNYDDSFYSFYYYNKYSCIFYFNYWFIIFLSLILTSLKLTLLFIFIYFCDGRIVFILID